MKITPTPTRCTQRDACPAWLVHGDCPHAEGKPGVPVLPRVTDRHLDLISQAASALAQVMYEGSHAQRQDPAPRSGSPWERPDLPPAVMQAAREAQEAAERLVVVARNHYLLDSI